MTTLRDELLKMAREVVRRELADSQEPVIRWGTVATTGTPPTIRFSGETSAVEVPIVAAGLTLTVGDIVCLQKVGSRWAVAWIITEV